MSLTPSADSFAGQALGRSSAYAPPHAARPCWQVSTTSLPQSEASVPQQWMAAVPHDASRIAVFFARMALCSQIWRRCEQRPRLRHQLSMVWIDLDHSSWPSTRIVRLVVTMHVGELSQSCHCIVASHVRTPEVTESVDASVQKTPVDRSPGAGLEGR